MAGAKFRYKALCRKQQYRVTTPITLDKKEKAPKGQNPQNSYYYSCGFAQSEAAKSDLNLGAKMSTYFCANPKGGLR